MSVEQEGKFNPEQLSEEQKDFRKRLEEIFIKYRQDLLAFARFYKFRLFGRMKGAMLQESPDDVVDEAFLYILRSERGHPNLLSALRKQDDRHLKNLLYLNVKWCIMRAYSSHGKDVMVPGRYGQEPPDGFSDEMQDEDIERFEAETRQENGEFEEEDLRKRLATLAEEKFSDPADALHRQELARVLEDEVLPALTPKQQTIIRMRFGLPHVHSGMSEECQVEHSLEEIGQTFLVTRERIRQLEKKILERLRKPGEWRRKLEKLL